MPVKVSIDKNAVKMRIQGASGRALKETMGQILSDCNEFCPKDQGTLRDSSISHSYIISFFGVTEIRLVWCTPYARFLYYGLLMVDSVTGSSWASKGGTKILTDKQLHYANGCKLWCEKAREMYNEDWLLIYQNAFNRNLR